MLLVVLCGFLINLTWSAGQGVLGYATHVSTSSLLQETNAQRSQNSRAALSLNAQLSKAAQAKANDMVAHNYWSHASPDGSQPWTFIANAGYNYTAAGENLAYGFDSSSATVTGWMNSASHRTNLLNSEYSEVGFGIANATNFQENGEQTIIVAMYAHPQQVAAAQSAPTTTPSPKKASQPAASQPTTTTPAEQKNEQPVDTTQPTPADNVGSTDTTNTQPVPQILAAEEVSRIDVLTDGNAQWAALVVSVLATVSIFFLLFSHIKLWRKYLIKGEQFVIRHPLLDAAILSVGVLGFILTRTSGFIH